MVRPLERLQAGQQLVVGGDRYVTIGDELASVFRRGDRLVVVDDTGDVLHVPAAEHAAAAQAVTAATAAFAGLADVDDEQLSSFFSRFADFLADDVAMAPVLDANAADVMMAREAGRSTTRLVLSPQMRDEMIAGLRGWHDSPVRRDGQLGVIRHVGWTVESRRAPLGVVAFVFEGRPNVLADAVGVLRSGNTVAMRIGSDALATAEAILERAIAPALDAAELPAGAVALVRSRSRAAGWALFSDRRVSLAVARGSGPAVSQLGAVARQHGIPVSLHGTGGAWLVAGLRADAERFATSVVNSLDRKVCNTLNVCCIPEPRAADLVPAFLGAAGRASAALGTSVRLHADDAATRFLPPELLTATVTVRRADGEHLEPAVSPIERGRLGTEWEWEGTPELSLVVTASVDAAVELCNRYSPRFVAALVSTDAGEHERFYAAVDAPFVGDGMTRWVDGQYALGTPELGLSNWQFGRLLGRGGILSGESVHTVRHRARITDPALRR